MTRQPRRFMRVWLTALLLLVALVAGLRTTGDARAATGGVEFDHLKTGFALTGAHQNQRCESCHQAGVFKGTPRDCDSCHTAGARLAKTNIVKPSTHIPTTQSCDSCHGTRSFTGARMDHKGVAAGSCVSCHNGILASGKPADHLPTTASCDSCHRTAAWKPASGFSHAGVAPGSCATCHNGVKATGKSANHTPFTTVAALANLACDSCHKAGFAAWTPAKLHASATVTDSCASCHASSKPNTAVHAGQSTCENCHKSTTAWAGAKVDHSGFTAATNCASCHNGSAATGKTSTHIPVGATNCATCHATTGWKPTKWNHTQLPVTGQCASCHSGAFPPADGKPATHTPYTGVAALASLGCDSCHKAGFTAWAPAKLHASVNVTDSCASCHASSKPNTAVHAGQSTCENCHKSTTAWAGAKVDHSGFTAATNCASCHNGSAATGKTSTHIPVGATNCATCHATTGWKPTKWNHTQLPVTGQCASCHSGAFPPADGKPATHTPYTGVAGLASLGCDSCHKAGFTAWAPAKLHASVNVTDSCASCHASSKPNTAVHAGQSTCENCHKSTTAWAGAKVDHSGFTAATNCASCHNGSAATGKTSTHIPVGATNCATCHATTGWKPTKWNHTQLPVTGQCASCHSGAFPPADGKPATHTPYTGVAGLASLGCDSCHKAGFTAWAPAKLHASVSVSSSCASCHAGVKPNTAIHAGQTTCENCHKSTSSWNTAKVDHSGFTAATNCASCHNGSAATGKPAAHIPVGAANCISCHATTGWKPTKWNHTQLPVTGQCASCHSGAFPPADGKPATHTPYQLVASLAASNCDSCHKAGYTAWAPARLHASVTVIDSCASCHASSKPNTAIHAGQTTCENCHKSASSWNTAKVDHSGFTAATNCASCHNGSAATGKPAAHIPVGAANCISCHATTGWKPTKWNHTQLPVTGQCASCHSGAFPPADGKPATHTPYQLVASLAASNCDSCHKAGYTAWAPARLHASVAVIDSCASCHASSKPNTAIHAGQTTCENCHKSTSSWNTAKVDHSGFTAATNCASCHNGSAATGKPAAHIPVAATNCISCHATTGWKPTKWNHTQLPVAGQCASCHSGAFPPADGKSASHTPYQLVGTLASANCDSCHKAGYTSWTPAKLHASVTVVNSCASCHASIKPNTTIHAGQTTCENCHKSTTAWSGAKVDHSGFTVATNCASCHNGSSATGKPTAHIPVAATNCISCHTTSGWKPTKWNHTQLPVTGQCASCHSGAYPPADGKSASHTPYQLVATLASANCDSCHKAGYTSWTPAKLHASVTVVNSCASCHASIKPNTTIHAGQTVCENCHRSTTTWTGAKVDHSSFTVATNCASCHNGSSATGKPAAHIPVAATNCISCHTTTGWKPTKWNHTQLPVANQCASCHNGAYPPADGKSASHTPYQLVATLAAANCDSCHKAGYTSWTPAKLHANVTVTTSCSSCHLSVRPANALHTGQTMCETCHKSTSTWTGAKVDHSTFTVATNCAGCHNGSTATGKPAAHIPSGTTNCISCHSTTGWKPTKWNHTQLPVAGQCASCHSGAYPPADGRPAGHIPYQTLTGVVITNCDSCHKAGYASWAGGRFHANVTVTGQCKTCHNGSYNSQGATAKPTNHIPEAQLLNGASMECNACHTSVTAWTQKMNHNGSQGSGAGWCKACHASGTNYLGSMERMSLTHRTKTPVPTDCSTSGCHRPLGNKGTPYTKWD